MQMSLQNHSWQLCALCCFVSFDGGLAGSGLILGTFTVYWLWSRMSALSSRVHFVISELGGQQQRHEKPVYVSSEAILAKVQLTHLGPTDLL